jgi:hypothetical protein
MIAHAMFDKGKHFVAAAVLLRQRNGHPEVVLHLLGQGLEVIQKGLLLARDYDRYKPRLIKPLGHNLIRGANALQAAYQFKPLKKTLRGELEALSHYYDEHLLRYGTIHDVFGAGARDLKHEAVFQRAVALTIFGNKLFK